MSRGLSYKLLVHSATLEAAGSPDAYGNISYGDAQELTRIRVSRSKETFMTQLGDRKDDKLILIYDLSKSLPQGVTFATNDRITFNGDKYLVRELDTPCGDSSTPVYYRARLVTDGN